MKDFFQDFRRKYSDPKNLAQLHDQCMALLLLFLLAIFYQCLTPITRLRVYLVPYILLPSSICASVQVCFLDHERFPVTFDPNVILTLDSTWIILTIHSC